MKRKLIPVAGALIAGLVGVAEACWYEYSIVCEKQDALIGYIIYGNCINREVHAATDWIGWATYYGTDGSPLQNNPTYCHGPAYFYDCTGQRVNIDDMTDGNPGVYRVQDGVPCS